MVFRAIFWIAVVALFAPHGETDRDGARCAYVACGPRIELLDRAEASLLHRLVMVRAEIEAAQDARNPR